MAKISVTMLAEVQNMRKGIDDTNKRLGHLGGAADKAGRLLKTAIIGAGAAWVGSKVKEFFGDSIAAGRESNKVMAQTNAVLKSTGGVAGVTANHVSNLANALSAKTGIDDEAIQSSENLLLTFTNLRNEAGKGNDIFDRTTSIVTDMSAALGQSAKSSAIQMGKALNDPIKGITALSRVGVSFTKQQKEQIKTLVDSGKTLDAQKVILGEVSKEFGGSAEAMATPGEKFKVMVGNIQESIGQYLIPILDKVETYLVDNLPKAIAYLKPKFEQFMTGLKANIEDMLPTIKQIGEFLLNAFQTAWPILQSVIGFLANNKSTVATFAAVILTVVAAMKIWTAVQTLLNASFFASPIGLIVIGVAALAAGLVYAYKHSETFRNIVNASFEAVATVAGKVVGFIKAYWKPLFVILTGPVGLATLFIAKHFDTVISAFQAIGKWGRWLWNSIFQPVFKFIVSGFGIILRTLSNVVGAFLHVPGASRLFPWAKDLAKMLDVAADKADSLKNHINDIPTHKSVDVVVNTIRGITYTAGGHTAPEPGSGAASRTRITAPRSRSTPINITLNANGIVQTDAELGERIVAAIQAATDAGMVAYA